MTDGGGWEETERRLRVERVANAVIIDEEREFQVGGVVEADTKGRELGARGR